MDHNRIIQALCRAALAQPTPAVRKQVERLRDALRDEGSKSQAAQLSKLLTAAERSTELAPSRITRSRAMPSGQALSKSTKAPVDRETGAPLATIVFPEDSSCDAPVLSPTVSAAVESLLEEWSNMDALLKFGVESPRTCLLYGAPGTGKTRLAMWLAKQVDLPVLVARIDGLVSSFLGTTARNIGNLFAFANRHQCILLLDEFDAVAKVRDDPQEIGEIKRVVNSLLQNLDERTEIGLIIGITNHQKLLDPAIWRRFEVQLEIPRPAFDLRVAIARSFLPPVKAPQSHLKLLAWFTDGATGAEVESLVRTYKKSIAIREDEQNALIPTLQKFATLNSARINEEKRSLLFSDEGFLFRRMSEDPDLDFTYEDIGKIVGVNKSTISRSIQRVQQAEAE